ncbi:hypothetical protein ACE7GA_03040 [Roseomonas sp. CCTCC AB2023176]|uniref:hypothetical protein n=1 Tax=Roseomonas sp. CCTCC AB2023176 TaxID=3342640 RepID=UPI0035D8AFEF
MAQLAPIVTLAATGASLYAANQQASKQKKVAAERARVQDANAVIQADNQAAQVAQQNAVLAAQQNAENAGRQRNLARTIAAARARLGASGIDPDEGSAAAVAKGLRAATAEAQSLDDTTYAARVSRGRQSLLSPDLSLQPSMIRAYADAGRSVASGLRSLLD